MPITRYVFGEQIVEAYLTFCQCSISGQGKDQKIELKFESLSVGTVIYHSVEGENSLKINHVCIVMCVFF